MESVRKAFWRWWKFPSDAPASTMTTVQKKKIPIIKSRMAMAVCLAVNETPVIISNRNENCTTRRHEKHFLLFSVRSSASSHTPSQAQKMEIHENRIALWFLCRKKWKSTSWREGKITQKSCPASTYNSHKSLPRSTKWKSFSVELFHIYKYKWRENQRQLPAPYNDEKHFESSSSGGRCYKKK